MTSQLRLIALALTALALSAASLPGCALLEYLQNAPKPKISFKNAKLDKLSWTDADMTVNFKLDNPYPVAINLQRYNWDLKVSGEHFLGGDRDKKVSVAAQKSSTIPVPFSFKFADLLSRIAAAKSKAEVPYELAGKVTLETPVGPVSLPMKATGDLPVLEIPKVRFKTVTARMQGMTKLLVEVGLGVDHANEYKIKLADLGYDLKLESYKVASGKLKPGKSIDSGGEVVIKLPIEVDLISASSALMSSIMSGKFRYALATDLGLDTPFGRAPLAFADDGSIKLY